MKSKKSNEANLETRRSSFFQFGIIISLSLTLVAFEWSNGMYPVGEVSSNLGDELPPELIIDHVVEEKKLSAPTPLKTETKFIEEVEVSDKKIIVIKKKTEKFIEIDLSEFEGETEENDSIEIEPIRKPKMFEGDFSLLDGYIPHYKDCANSSGKEMFDCVNQEIGNYVSSSLKMPSSISYTGSKRVLVTFIVDEEGDVSEIYIHKKKKYEKDVVKEVERVLNSLPNMIPGKQGEYPLKMRFTLPISLTSN